MNRAAPDLHASLETVMRQDRGRLLSALISVLGDFELAEEALSDALESALIHWARSGLPDNPIGWLLKVARRKAIDRIRRAKRFREHATDIAHLAAMDELDAHEPLPDIPDERLRLIFTCCHPALEPKTRVALTLRTLGGLTTSEIAAAFLDGEPAMGQRLSRARKKITRARIPFSTPEPHQWGERVNSVLAVIYLIFNQGYGATSGALPTRVDLCDEAVFLARLLERLTPGDAEIEGLLALVLISHGRRAARVNASGGAVALDDQDRQDWDHQMIAEGRSALNRAVGRAIPGPYQIKAAISALHAEASGKPDTDWHQITLLYESLFRFEPTPIVALNRAVAMAENGALQKALLEFDQLGDMLADYQPFHAAHGEYLARDGQKGMAADAYAQAIELTGNSADRNFLRQRLAGLSPGTAKT